MHRQSSVILFFFLKSCFPSLFLIIFFRLSPYCFAMSTGIFINYFKRLLRQHVVGGNQNIVLCPDVLTQLAPFYVVQILRQNRLTAEMMPPQRKGDFLKCVSNTCMSLHRNPGSRKHLTRSCHFSASQRFVLLLPSALHRNPGIILKSSTWDYHVSIILDLVLQESFQQVCTLQLNVCLKISLGEIIKHFGGK